MMLFSPGMSRYGISPPLVADWCFAIREGKTEKSAVAEHAWAEQHHPAGDKHPN